uniref:Uncharacterized protein n=1 Tax=Anguilla anguilla TaxID=7936 RepID=A0A0E9VVM0_ANGAN
MFLFVLLSTLDLLIISWYSHIICTTYQMVVS